MKKRSILSGVILGAAFSVFMAAPVFAKEMEIPAGIFVGDFELDGMTRETANQTIQDYIHSLSERAVTLNIEGKPVETTAGALGFTWSNPDAVEEAMSHVSGGNLIQQYMERMDLQKDPVHVSLETAVDGTSFSAFVEEQCQGMTAEPKNAEIARVNGAFQITPEVDGRAVDVETTRQTLEQVLSEQSVEPAVVDAAITIKEAAIKAEQLACIQDELGSFSTNFNSGNASRSGNLKVGASKINGAVIMPGETLSGYEYMHPFTTSNGYFTAAAYENGKVVDSVGGGVCQISTTLYQAALRAELDITQRQNHSMIVTYVQPSMDAAIAGTFKDLKITNNSSNPVYVEGGVHGRTLTFTIYGKETRPANRTLEFISETISTTDPGAPEERHDNSLPPGTRKQIQSAHTGMKSKLWKVVKIDGVEKERTLLSTDTYRASKAVVLVGPPLPAAPAETVPAETNPVPSEPQIVEGIQGGPGVVDALPPAETNPAVSPIVGPGV